MSYCVFMLQVMDIVCADELQAQVLCKFGRLLANHCLAVDSMILYLDIEIVAEYVFVDLSGFIGFPVVTVCQMGRNDAPGTCRRGNKPLPVHPEHFRIDSGFVVEALEMSD